MTVVPLLGDHLVCQTAVQGLILKSCGLSSEGKMSNVGGLVREGVSHQKGRKRGTMSQ